MDNYPKWLPSVVYEHTECLIKKDVFRVLQPLVLRLITNPEMESVWIKLSDKTTNSQKLIDFLDYVRLHPALQINATAPILIPSDNLQRRAFKKISDLSQSMINELRKLSSTHSAQAEVSTSDPEEGWRLLETALKRAELDQVDKVSQVILTNSALHQIKQLQARLNDIQQHESVISILQLIGSAAKSAATAPDSTLPKRRHSERAQYNLLILDLKKYLKLHFNLESHQLIANVVNTAFEAVDGGISADDVRKLNS